METAEDIKRKVRIAEWQIADTCNYCCSYCNAKIDKTVYPRLKDYCLFIDKLDSYLKGNWLIHLGGYGEPFAVPDFFEIVSQLIMRNYYLGLVTNFSYPVEDSLRFCQATQNKLLYFNASFHMEFADLDLFLKNALKVKKVIGDLFEISVVGQKEKTLNLIKVCRTIKEKEIPVIFQAEKIGRNYRRYSEDEVKIISEEFGYVYALKRENRFGNKKCLAGKDYFVLENNGNGYICNPYRFAHRESKNKNHGYLGNILNGTFTLGEKEIICDLEMCSCSTPWRIKGWRNK